MITERYYLKATSLAEIHDLLNAFEQAGWTKATTLMYTHDGEKQGWEIAMERPVEGLEPAPPVYNVLGWIGVSIVCTVLAVAAWVGIGKFMEML